MTGPVAIFPWGEVIEVFLDPLGLTADDFAARMDGGWLFGYVAALARQGRDAVIVYVSERVRTPERLIHAGTGAPIWLVPGRRTGAGRSRRSPSLQAVQQWRATPWRAFDTILTREGCSAVLVQDYEHARFDVLALLARRRGLPLFATFQGGDVTASSLEARVRRVSLGLCDGLIVPSARERHRLEHSYGIPADRLHAIPNPVDVVTWRPGPRAHARAALGIEPNGFLVAWHGRVDVHRKGLDVLLEAWRRVQASRPQAKLVLIGSGQDHAAFATLIAGVPGVEWRCNYTTDPAEVRLRLSAADAYVTLSRTEGLPVAPLEAMACGLPVVASDAHGLADIFAAGEAAGGLLVAREDAIAAAAALGRLADDTSLRARLGEAARREVERSYAPDVVGRHLAAVLDRMSAFHRPEVPRRSLTACPG
jgi:starch synthase